MRYSKVLENDFMALSSLKKVQIRKILNKIMTYKSLSTTKYLEPKIT